MTYNCTVDYVTNSLNDLKKECNKIKEVVEKAIDKLENNPNLDRLTERRQKSYEILLKEMRNVNNKLYRFDVR